MTFCADIDLFNKHGGKFLTFSMNKSFDEHSIEGQEKFAQLCNHIRDSQTLTYLTLNKLDLSGNLCHLVCEALMHNKTVKSVSLKHCFLCTDADSNHLSYLIAFNDCIRYLYLDGNDINEEGALKIIDSLKTSKSIRTFSFGQNKIPRRIYFCFVECAAANPGLKTLFFADDFYTRVQAVSAEELQKHMADKGVTGCRIWLSTAFFIGTCSSESQMDYSPFYLPGSNKKISVDANIQLETREKTALTSAPFISVD